MKEETKEEVKELTEVEKAQKVVAEAERVELEAFNKELQELCEKRGFTLDVQAQIIIRKK